MPVNQLNQSVTSYELPAPAGGQTDNPNANTWQGHWQSMWRVVKSLVNSSNSGNILFSYAVANLPATASEGYLAYATNGRKVGEGGGSGTGVPVYYSTGKWRVFSTDAQVAA